MVSATHPPIECPAMRTASDPQVVEQPERVGDQVRHRVGRRRRRRRCHPPVVEGDHLVAGPDQCRYQRQLPGHRGLTAPAHQHDRLSRPEHVVGDGDPVKRQFRHRTFLPPSRPARARASRRGSTRCGCRRGRPRTTGASPGCPRPAGSGGRPGRAPGTAHRDWTPRRAGWAFRAGRKSSSTPRWTLTGPRSNQQPPRAASSGRLGDPREAEQPGEERLGPGLGLGPGGMASCTWSMPSIAVAGRGHATASVGGRSRWSRRSGWSSGTSTRWIREPVGIVDPRLDETPWLEGGRAGPASTPRPTSSSTAASMDRTCSHSATGPSAGSVARTRARAGRARHHFDQATTGEEDDAPALARRRTPGPPAGRGPRRRRPATARGPRDG